MTTFVVITDHGTRATEPRYETQTGDFDMVLKAVQDFELLPPYEDKSPHSFRHAPVVYVLDERPGFGELEECTGLTIRKTLNDDECLCVVSIRLPDGKTELGAFKLIRSQSS